MLKPLLIFFSTVFLTERTTLLSKMPDISSDILTCTDYKIIKTLLFGNTLFNQLHNNRICNAKAACIASSKNFMAFFSILTKVCKNGKQANVYYEC